jgi:hypothetical protein
MIVLRYLLVELRYLNATAVIGMAIVLCCAVTPAFLAMGRFKRVRIPITAAMLAVSIVGSQTWWVTGMFAEALKVPIWDGHYAVPPPELERIAAAFQPALWGAWAAFICLCWVFAFWVIKLRDERRRM